MPVAREMHGDGESSDLSQAGSEPQHGGYLKRWPFEARQAAGVSIFSDCQSKRTSNARIWAAESRIAITPASQLAGPMARATSGAVQDAAVLPSPSLVTDTGAVGSARAMPRAEAAVKNVVGVVMHALRVWTGFVSALRTEEALIAETEAKLAGAVR